MKKAPEATAVVRYTVEQQEVSRKWVVMAVYPSGYKLATHFIFSTEEEGLRFVNEALQRIG